jgi:hypothetical protein
VVLQRKTLPAWAVQLVLGSLLFAPLLVAVDGLARARRRRLHPGRWALWTLSCSLPFLACAVFAYLLGALGILGAAPPTPAAPGALPFDGGAAAAVVSVLLVFALAWLQWHAFVRRRGWGARPDPEVAGLSMLLVLLAAAILVWAIDPFAALLLIPALHVWLLLAAPELRPRPLAALGLVAVGLLPLALLVLFYAHQLGLGPGAVAWTALLLVAGGHVGPPAAIVWCVGLGCAAVAVMLCVTEPPPPRGPSTDDFEITIRGPMSYAGPGSLGGTESALRR